MLILYTMVTWLGGLGVDNQLSFILGGPAPRSTKPLSFHITFDKNGEPCMSILFYILFFVFTEHLNTNLKNPAEISLSKKHLNTNLKKVLQRFHYPKKVHHFYPKKTSNRLFQTPRGPLHSSLDVCFFLYACNKKYFLTHLFIRRSLLKRGPT